MKRLKRLTALLLCTAMTCMMCGMVSLAASGEMRFSDPSTTVGAKVEITVKLSADEGLGTIDAILNYDSTALRFVSGDSASGENGQVALTGVGGGASELSWTLTFQALSEGTTVVNVSQVTASTSSGSSVNITEGTSTVTIGEGDPSLIEEEGTDMIGGGGDIEIDGQIYSVSTEIPEVLIPDGFVEADMPYNGNTYAATIQENGTMYAIYLKDANEEEDFWLYNPEKDTFSPFEQVSISDSRYIVLLSDDMTEELPDTLQKTTMTVDGKDFPAWQNMDAASYYVVYALNSDGETGYYQYDTVDETYQRYTPETVSEEDETSRMDGFINQLRNNLDKVILIVWGIFLVMLILLIVLGVKLRHRNLELDDLYDEYGIDEEDEEEMESQDAVGNRNSIQDEIRDERPKRSRRQREEEFFDFDEPEDEYYDIGDEYDEEMYGEDDFDEYDESPFKEYNPSDYEDNRTIDDLDKILNEHVRVKKKAPRQTGMTTVGAPGGQRRAGHAEADDTFKLDLIDLD